jgi:hypothetical protein
MKKTVKKKVVSLILIFQIIFTMMPMQAFADMSYFESQNELLLKEELRKSADETQYPNGLFEFLAESMNTSEDLSSVEFAIVRKGGTAGKASITFKAIDVTAKYGEDYTISVPTSTFPITLPDNPDSKPLIDSFEDIENTAVTTSSGIQSVKSQVTTGSSIQYEELPWLQSPNEVGGLRSVRDAFTKTTSGRTTWREADRETKDRTLKAQSEMFDGLPGVTYTFNFEDGEYIKKIRFNTIDDTISEDEEQIVFSLLYPEGGSLGENINAYMNIEDNEEKEKVQFEMVDEQIMVDRLSGYAEVKVRRTAGLYRYGLIRVGTAALTAEPGVDYEPLSTELRFVPGQETQTVKIPLLKGINLEELNFIVKLDPESPNISENTNIKTIVTIIPKSSYLMEVENISGDITALQILSAPSLKTVSAVNLKVYLKNIEENEDSIIEGNEDAYIKPKTWKSATISETGPAQYVGTLAFAEDYDSTIKTYTTSDIVELVPKYSENFKNTSKVFLLGYKIERKGGLQGDRYYYINKDKLDLGELYNNRLYDDVNGKQIPIKEVLMDGNTIAILPVFKAKGCFVQINFDPAKGGMDKESFSNGQIVKVGAMDTIEFKAYAIGSNSVSGYNHVHAYGSYRNFDSIPDFGVERFRYSQDIEGAKMFFGNMMTKFYHPINGININPSLPGELKFSPAKTFSKLTVRYGTSCLTVMADPTFDIRDKGRVAYIPDKGTSQAGNSEISMIISPIEHNKMYTISGVPDDGYRMVWKDWSGDINRDGKLDQEEVDNLGKYEANFDRKAVAGNFFTYVPFYDHPLIYYSFEPKGSSTSMGVVSGRILLRGRNILNLSGGQNMPTDKPLTGVSLNIDGHTVYTDEEGRFEIKHSDFRSNEYHNIVITYKGINYIGHVNVNAFTNIVINEYDAFNPFNFKAYNLSSNDKVIDFRIIDNRDANYKFRFEVVTLKQGITAAKAIIRFYSKDGVERIDSRIEVTPKNGAFTFEFNPSSLGIVPGDNMTVQFVDQNGLVYMEHNAGFVFKKYLNTFSLLSSFKTPLKPAVDFVGSIDAAFDLGLAGKADEYLDKTGKNGTEWIITFGFDKDWEKSLSDGSDVKDEEDAESSKNAAAEELKEAAKSENMKDTVNQSVDKTNDEKKSASITSDLKFGISTSLYLRMTVDEDPASIGYGEAYFNEMIMSATLTFDYNRKAERMTPIGVTLFVEMNIGGQLTGMTVIEKYDKKFYFNENGEIDFSNSGTNNLDRDFTIYGKLMVKPYIQLSVGAEITGAKVTLSGKAEFDLNFTTTGSGTGTVRLTSELTLKVLFFEYTWEIEDKKWDLFSYGRMGKFSMDSLLGDTGGLYESAEDYQVTDRDYINNRGQWQGENRVFTVSENGLETTPQNEQVLQTGIYPYPYTLLATIGENQQLLIFLDDDISHDDRNRTQLFYSIYNGASWSIPEKVDDDNTPDGLPWIYDIGDKVLVAWSSSVFEIDSDDTVMSVLNNRNIKARFFNKDDKTFEDVQDVTYHTIDDTYADTEPYAAYWKNDAGKENLMIVYKKSEYKPTAGDSDESAVVGDIINPYSTLAYRFYDFERNVWDDRALGGEMPGMFYGQGFIDLSKYVYVDDSDIVIKDGGIWTGLWGKVPTGGAITLENMPDNDPCVVDSNAIGYDNHAVLAYVADLDNNLGTTVDREIFLQLYSFEDKQFYPPIRLTDDMTGQYCLEFVSEGENVYLYYLSDGDIQSIDIGYLLEEGLLEYELEGEVEGTFDKVYVLSKLKGVYRSPETAVHHSYDTVKDGAGNEIVVNEMPIDEFMVKSDDNNTYAVWVQGDITYKEGIDPNSEEASLPGNQYRENHIYAAKRTINEETAVWSDMVKITEGKGANYNDVDFEILPDDMIRIVFVKGFSKPKTVGGQQISVEDINNRTLMTADYDVNERNTSIEIKPVYVQKPGYIVPLDIKVHNISLSELNNITYEVWQVSGKVSEIAASGELQLRGGERKDLSVMWHAPDKLNDTALKVLVKDGDDILCSDEHKIITQSIVDVVGAYADFVGRNKIIVSGVAVNNGNIETDEAVILAEFSGIEAGSVNIGELSIGEAKEFMFLAEIDSEMFESNENDDGSVESVLELSVHSKTGKGIKLNLERYADAQDVETINNIESFTLKSGGIEIGEQISLRRGTEINIEPHLTFSDVSSDKTRIVFESSNDAVADISTSGRLTGESTGRAVITAYVMPKINNIILSSNNFTKVDNFETLAEEAIKTKSFVLNVTKQGSSKPKEDVFEDSIKPEVSVNGNNKITFKDVAEDAWYYDAVSFIAAKGITVGTGDGYFNPDAKLTRGQFIVVIMRAYEIKPDDDYEDNFADANDTYYTGYLAAAKRLGLSSGIGNNLFAPDNYITRQEMFTLLYRLLKAFDDLPEAIEKNTLASFIDADQIDSWALDAMTLFADSLIIRGSGQQINPKETTNRAQMAQVLYNILK